MIPENYRRIKRQILLSGCKKGKLMSGTLSMSAQGTSALTERFVNSLYIGRAQIYSVETERRPHKFYYIGYRDTFGVKMPGPRNTSEYQIWIGSWVWGRSKKLDDALNKAMKGKFPNCRHNYQIKVRAKLHGETFTKPEWYNPAKAPAVEKTNLPIRGRKIPRRRKGRRRLTI